MFRRGINILKYRLERLLLRGTHARLLVMAGLVGLVSVLGGYALVAVDPGEQTHGAIWWAFLRLTDPGYLGDDVGMGRRALATIITVLGYVIFMGSLVAIMTQWLTKTVQDLESGLTPIAGRGHIVVVGLTSRTAVIAGETFRSESRVKRFLSLYDTRGLRLVFLLEKLDAQVRHQLRNLVGRVWRNRSVTMRSGSALHLEDLRRVDVANAAAVLIPSDDVGSTEGAADARTIKTLLLLSHHLEAVPNEQMPLVVTELFNSQRLSIARRAYPGPVEFVCSDRLIGRLVALTAFHPGLSKALDEILAYGLGNEIHVIEAPELNGLSVDEVRARLPRGVFLGFTRAANRTFQPRLCLPGTDKMGPGERIVVLASSHEDAIPTNQPYAPLVQNPADSAPQPPPIKPLSRVLVLGWSDRVPDLIREFAQHQKNPITLHSLSSVSVEEREADLANHRGMDGADVTLLHGDITRREVISAQLEHDYDRIVLVASDWVATEAHSDARTVLTYLLVRDELSGREKQTPMVVELMEAANRKLISEPGVDVIVSPLVIGRVLAHSTLRRELRSVYDDFFDADGPAVHFRPGADYNIDDGSQTFHQLSRTVEARGDVLLGTVSPGGAFSLNPAKMNEVSLGVGSQLVVLTRARG